MTRILDGDPFYSGRPGEESIRAIGWLSREDEYVRGTVHRDFFDKLVGLCQSPWQPFASAGLHECDLCQFEGPYFKDVLCVPYAGTVLLAPLGIVHYVGTHWYRPPDYFMAGVMECPAMNSMEYKKALLANGGRSMVRAATGRQDSALA